ncbi:T9SS type A sorting domain-containing protein, partial [bacterium]|nr:T9SS type A sorting domain-containing protein [bacterium]
RGLVSPRIVFSLNSNRGRDSLLTLKKRDGISSGSDNGKCLRVAAMRFVLENMEGHKNSKTGKIEWAILFANSEREINRNMKRALKTYEGTTDKNGRKNWVAFPIRTSRINLETDLATVWKENKKEKSVVMKIPFDLVDISIKWIKIDGLKTSNYTKVGSDILVPIGSASGSKEDSIRIEGEFTNGMLFLGETKGVVEGEEQPETTPDDCRLPQSFMKLYPNPFVDKVNIILSIPGSENIKVSNSSEMLIGSGIVRIYDVKGMLVQKIIDRKVFYPGEYSVSWDGTDKRGEPVAPGVYYCNLQIDSKTLTKRIVLIR